MGGPLSPSKRGHASRRNHHPKLVANRGRVLRIVFGFLLVTVGLISASQRGFWDLANTGMGYPPGETEKSERKLMTNQPGQHWSGKSCKKPSAKELVELPNLISIQKWSSKKQRSSQSITIVTQLSLDRLPSLENQCFTWTDHLTAIAYLPMVGNSSGGPPLLPTFVHTSMEDVIRGLEAFHHYVETTGACAFHLELVGQFVQPTNFPGPYPVNALRNRAMRSSLTDLAVPMDADFVLTPYLGLPGMGYKDPKVYAELQAWASARKALVVPAFELTNTVQDLELARHIARDIVVAGKSMARGALKGKAAILKPYQAPDNPSAHESTNATHWMDLPVPTLYQVQYTPTYEPIALLSLSAVPWFDERFVDYGGGAAAWFNHLSAMQFSFLVHPFGFGIHVPHARKAAASQYMEAQRRQREARMHQLRRRIESDLVDGQYLPVLRECTATAEDLGGIAMSNDELQRQQQEQQQQILTLLHRNRTEQDQAGELEGKTEEELEKEQKELEAWAASFDVVDDVDDVEDIE